MGPNNTCKILIKQRFIHTALSTAFFFCSALFQPGPHSFNVVSLEQLGLPVSSHCAKPSQLQCRCYSWLGLTSILMYCPSVNLVTSGIISRITILMPACIEHNTITNTHTLNTYTMMLLMGMWISLTKNPMKPMIANPIAVATAIFWNSDNGINQWQVSIKRDQCNN